MTSSAPPRTATSKSSTFDAGDDARDSTLQWSARTWWTLAGVALINWSVQLLGATTSFSWVAALMILAGGWGLGIAVLSWLPAARPAGLQRHANVVAWLTAVLVIVLFVAWAYVQVRNAPGYGTDELAFNQYAAQLASHGIDPYRHSMAPAFPEFQVSPDGYTYTLAGAPVTALSYPALAFLAYVPFLLLGWSTQLAVVINVIAWAGAVLLMFALIPRPQRAAALVLGSVAVYIAYAVGGVTDSLYVPLLVGAAYRWDRFGLSRWSYLGPVLLGLATAMKQTPWPLVPLIVCALALDEYQRSGRRGALRRGGIYLLVAGVAFLVPNLPYLIAAPGPWLHGVLTPLDGDIVPAGQGTVALSLFLRLGGGSLLAYSAAAVLMALLVILVYIRTYPLLRPATFLLPAVVLFFASRSYGNYLAELLPAALVGATTIGPAVARTRQASHKQADRAGSRWRPTRWRVAIGGAATLFVVVLIHAVTARPPLTVHIAAVRTTGQLATIEQLKLDVTNDSGSAVHPAFTLDEGGGLTTFWHVARGPSTLAAGKSTTYTIVAPNFPAQPSIGGGFSVVAFVEHPASVSATGPYIPDALHVALVPDAVNAPVPTGRPVVVTAELLDQLDRPVHRADVPIYVGQIIYDQTGLELSEAVVNGKPPGQTPVRALTNDKGVATFTVVGTQANSDPVYFEANLVNSVDFFPYGYSPILPIRFVTP